MIICKICEFESKNLTTHIIKKHNISTKDYKKQYGVEFLQSEDLRLIHKNSINSKNPTKGKSRSKETLEKISKNRKGKGIGVVGKYERTSEIKEKISSGVVAAHFRGDFDNAKPGNSSYVFCKKANQTIFARSTWEARIIKVFDNHPRINKVINEPFKIPYVFEGVNRSYIPDFLITYDEVIKSIWEVKRDDFILGDPKTVAKLKALDGYCTEHGLNVFIINLKTLKELEDYTENRIKNLEKIKENEKTNISSKLSDL